ncbi:MAG: type II secretion system protein [Selenomonadaceae bacterium]|nr:type II secretion system protein [Selenomonadaceae bacterium]
MNQRGFATLEVILMVMVIGILASIAVPRFGNVTAEANTAKIRADLSTIDTAVAVYYMENGKYPTSTTIDSSNTELKPYLRDIGNIKPPTGSCYIGKDTAETVPGTEYTLKEIDSKTKEVQAVLGDKTAGEFYKGSSSTSGGTGGTT